MTKSTDNENYSEKEAQRRFMASLKAAVTTPPKPLKSMTPKRPKKQRKRAAKKA
ncbi:MAG: hypothetical protein QOJ96_1327 [Alphaproteobacteria bacterium]|jgi:hypothetical protein|nr:hypothetical protein [Alphaproteobacteria bacterium]